MTNLSGANLNNGAAVGPQGEGMDSPSTFPKYPDYKDSGADWCGVVPAEWQILKLKRVARLQSGEFITSEAIEEEAQYPVYGGNGLRGYTTAHTHEGEYALVGRQGALCGNINYACGKFWASEHAVVVYPERGAVTRWFGELLRSMNLGQYSVSAAQPGLSVERIADLFIPVPSPIEQTQIARFLDHETARIDALIAEQQRLIELLKEKRQAVISHAVTKGLDPAVPMKDSAVEWLGEVPAHWDVGALKHFISPVPGAIKTGPFGSHLKSEDMKEGPYKVFNQRSVIDADFSAGDNFISEEKFAELRGFTAFPGDVLVTTRGTIGRAAILPDNAEVGILHPCLLRVQVEKSKITSSYLCRLVQESHLLKTQLSLMSNSTTIEVIYSETMANLLIPVPPITEQGQIAAFLDDVIRKFGALTNDANESVRLLQERRSALISAAVTGKIDVRGWQPPASAPSPEFELEAV